MFTLLLQIPLAAGQSHGPVDEGKRDWLIISYMSADNDLWDEAQEDLKEMEAVGSDDNITILVLKDSQGDGNTNAYLVNENGLIEIPLVNISSDWNGTDELNLGDGSTMEKYLSWALDEYPAEHYMLDIWGHGAGWEGVCLDGTDWLTMTELSDALDSVLDPFQKFDLITLAACQMGMAEAIYEIGDMAEYVVSSEIDIPEQGWDYSTILSKLKDNPDMGPEELGKVFVNEYLYWSYTYSGYSITLSLIKQANFPQVVRAINNLSYELKNDMPYYPVEIRTARGMTESYEGKASYDIYHFSQNLQTIGNKRITSMAKNVMDAINNTVIYSKQWTKPDQQSTENAHGLSISFPNTGPAFGYSGTPFAQATYWDEFLTTYGQYLGINTRTEAGVNAGGESNDPDNNGLADEITISCTPEENGKLYIDILNSSEETIWSNIESSKANESVSYTPSLAVAGWFDAAIYLRADNGTLLNYTEIDNLRIDKRIRIYGKISNARDETISDAAVALEIGKTFNNISLEDGRYSISARYPIDFESAPYSVRASKGLAYNRSYFTVDEDISVTQIHIDLQIENPPGTDIAIFLLIVINIGGLVSVVIYMAKFLMKNKTKILEDMKNIK